MSIDQLLKDKGIKAKEKTVQINTWLLDNTLSIASLISHAQNGKDPVKALCIEAIEFATKQNPSIATEAVLYFVTQTLTEKSPRIKWESARVIGNIAHLFPSKLDRTISNLLDNAEHPSTVVRWSTAYALGEILKLKCLLMQNFYRRLKLFVIEKRKIVSKRYTSLLLRLCLNDFKLN